MPDAEVVFTTGSLNALDLLLGGWPADRRRVACLPGEYGPNLALMAAHGFDRQLLPTLEDGRLALDDAALALDADPPDLVHLTAVGQPQRCGATAVDDRAAVPRVGAAAGRRRRPGAGPGGLRGRRRRDLFVVAQVDRRAARCRGARGAPRADGAACTRGWRRRSGPRARSRSPGNSNSAKPISLRALAFRWRLGEHLAYGPQAVRARLAELGGTSRTVLADVAGWAVVEEVDEPSAITTLAPVDGADPQAVRTWLLAERRILTTFVGRAAGAPGAGRAGAADLAARRHHGRRCGDLRRGADRRDGGDHLSA